MTASSSSSTSQEASNYGEVSMQQSLLFSDSLKDLKTLKAQLYSAAEYFELSYTRDGQKQTVVDSLKDYTIKALVNTVDHLGSMTYKVNNLFDEKVDEVSGTELRLSCIEQRVRTSREFIDREGVFQQSSLMNTPKYHKRYILPVGETTHGPNRTKLKYQGLTLDEEDVWHQFTNAIRTTVVETPSAPMRKGRSLPPSPRASQHPGNFAFTSSMPKREQEKRSVSPYRFPLLHSGSLATRSVMPNSSRPTTPNPSRPTTPNPSAKKRHPPEPRKSYSMRLPADREDGKDIERHPSKSKRLLKSLLSRRKSKKDDEPLFMYLDEY